MERGAWGVEQKRRAWGEDKDSPVFRPTPHAPRPTPHGAGAPGKTGFTTCTGTVEDSGGGVVKTGDIDSRTERRSADSTARAVTSTLLLMKDATFV